jgi:hypothetical protein
MDKIAQELEIHSTIEEESFYPAAKNVRGGQSLVNEPNPNTRQSTPSCRGSGHEHGDGRSCAESQGTTGCRRSSRD